MNLRMKSSIVTISMKANERYFSVFVFLCVPMLLGARTKFLVVVFFVIIYYKVAGFYDWDGNKSAKQRLFLSVFQIL